MVYKLNRKMKEIDGEKERERERGRERGEEEEDSKLDLNIMESNL